MTVREIYEAAREAAENEHFADDEWSFDPLNEERIKEALYDEINC